MPTEPQWQDLIDHALKVGGDDSAREDAVEDLIHSIRSTFLVRDADELTDFGTIMYNKLFAFWREENSSEEEVEMQESATGLDEVLGRVQTSKVDQNQESEKKSMPSSGENVQDIVEKDEDKAHDRSTESMFGKSSVTIQDPVVCTMMTDFDFEYELIWAAGEDGEPITVLKKRLWVIYWQEAKSCSLLSEIGERQVRDGEPFVLQPGGGNTWRFNFGPVNDQLETWQSPGTFKEWDFAWSAGERQCKSITSSQ